MSENEQGLLLLYLILFITIFVIYFLPSFIAYNRNHHYKHIILVLNIFGATGVLWIVAMVWAIFPKEKNFIDPFVGNPTGTGKRNAGAVIGESIRDAKKINDRDAKKINDIERLSRLYDQGKISSDEYDQLKKDLI